jgi:hypothetical protein
MPLRVPPRLALCLALALLPVRAAAQGTGSSHASAAPVDAAALQRLLGAEDARGTGRDGLEPLVGALTSADTLLRRVAVRGLGRFQRPELGRQLLTYLADPAPSVRAEAANAVAQSMRRVRRAGTTEDSSQLTTRDAAAALARALSHALAMTDAEIGRLGEAARRRALQTFTRERYFREMTALYESLLGRPVTSRLEPAA